MSQEKKNQLKVEELARAIGAERLLLVAETPAGLSMIHHVGPRQSAIDAMGLAEYLRLWTRIKVIENWEKIKRESASAPESPAGDGETLKKLALEFKDEVWKQVEHKPKGRKKKRGKK